MASSKNNKTERHCCFCGRGENEVNLLLSGMDGYICDDCVRMAGEYLGELEHAREKEVPAIKVGELQKPKAIKEFLLLGEATAV